MLYPVVGCPCAENADLAGRAASAATKINAANNVYNKRFETNGPHDVVLVGGNGNGDPVKIAIKAYR